MTAQKEKNYKEEYKRLIDKASLAGLSIIEDKINHRGGVCRLDGRIIVIFDKNSRIQERNRLINEALALAIKNSPSEQTFVQEVSV